VAVLAELWRFEKKNVEKIKRAALVKTVGIVYRSSGLMSGSG
jgi:hypothetical protein